MRDKKIKELGYHPSWQALGVIDNELIDNQHATYLSDGHSEHYRFSALKCYLSSKEHFSEKELIVLTDSVKNDSEIASTMYLYLLKSGKLSSNQYKYISIQFLSMGEWAVKKYKLIQLERMLANNSFSNNILFSIINNQNSKEHHLILEHTKQNKEVLRYLYENSNFKKIINQAKNILGKI